MYFIYSNAIHYSLIFIYLYSARVNIFINIHFIQASDKEICTNTFSYIIQDYFKGDNPNCEYNECPICLEELLPEEHARLLPTKRLDIY